MYQKYLKRILDACISLVGIIVLSPVFFIVAICVKATSKGPVLFKQERVGKNNVSFEILKFRTMRIDAPKNCPTHLLNNPKIYITKIGGFLRKTSLDELPQLYNVLKGEMSIVGPRPSLFIQNDLNELREKNGASSINPGLTGLAQVSGRDELEIKKKAYLDGVYASKITFLNDLFIFLKTIASVVSSTGIKEGDA